MHITSRLRRLLRLIISRFSRSMKTVFLTFLIAKFTLRVVAADSEFECVITADRTTYSVGEVPKVTFRIHNKTDKEVVLVGSLDGSDVGWRFPKCRLEILDAAGKPVTTPVARCGNMNPLRTTHFVVVPAGNAFDPFGKGFFGPMQLQGHIFPITTPGDYTLRFYYTTTTDRVEDYFGDERALIKASPEIQHLFERVPKLDLKSNELKLKFIPKPE